MQFFFFFDMLWSFNHAASVLHILQEQEPIPTLTAVSIVDEQATTQTISTSDQEAGSTSLDGPDMVCEVCWLNNFLHKSWLFILKKIIHLVLYFYSSNHFNRVNVHYIYTWNTALVLSTRLDAHGG